MPNGQVSDGEPHPDPRNGPENLCEEAVRLGVGFGKCSRGIEHHNTQEQPDPHGRRCQKHQDDFLAEMLLNEEQRRRLAADPCLDPRYL